MPIENRNLQIGTKLTGKYHKQPYECEVIQGEAGKLRYRLQDGREFKSPSAAGMAITGHACDGWTFWSEAKSAGAAVIATESATPAEVAPAPTEAAPAAETLAQTEPDETFYSGNLRVEVRKPAATPEEPRKQTKGVRKTANQKGAPEGMTRYYCYDCSQPFKAESSVKKPACPFCHNA